jgi:hypothetical protein
MILPGMFYSDIERSDLSFIIGVSVRKDELLLGI